MDLGQAIILATALHGKQKDKAGELYILHPLHVMLQMRTEEERIVAVLHDLLEDTVATVEDLKRLKFSDNISIAIETLTKQKGENYDEYLKVIKQNPLATAVKIEDLKHNIQLNRIAKLTTKDFERTEKYRKALDYLTAR
jgi:(p)ppGpp synthase/HD superfamily hydrolase